MLSANITNGTTKIIKGSTFMIPLSCPSTFFVLDNFYTDRTDQDLREALVFVQEIQNSHRTKPRVGLKGSPVTQ
jgi:hypothetical protein